MALSCPARAPRAMLSPALAVLMHGAAVAGLLMRWGTGVSTPVAPDEIAVGLTFAADPPTASAAAAASAAAPAAVLAPDLSSPALAVTGQRTSEPPGSAPATSQFPPGTEAATNQTVGPHVPFPAGGLGHR